MGMLGVIAVTSVVALTACAQQSKMQNRSPAAGATTTGASASVGSAGSGAPATESASAAPTVADTPAAPSDQPRANAPLDTATSDREVSRTWDGLGSTGGGTGTGTSSGTIEDQRAPAGTR